MSINVFYSCYEHSILLKTIAHHELGLHLINKIISNVLGNLFLRTQNTPHLELLYTSRVLIIYVIILILDKNNYNFFIVTSKYVLLDECMVNDVFV